MLDLRAIRPRTSPLTLVTGFIAVAISALSGPVVCAASSSVKVDPGTDIDCCREFLETQPYPPSLSDWTKQVVGCESGACSPVSRAARHIDQGNLDQARAVLETARSSDPTSPLLAYYLGEIALSSGEVPAAVEALTAAVQLRPSVSGFHALLGKALIASGSQPEGLKALRTAIAIAPGGARGHLDLGRAYLDTGQPDHAVVELERAIEIDNRCLEARYLYGRARMNSGDLKEGCAVLESYVLEARTIPAESGRVSRAQEILRVVARTS